MSNYDNSKIMPNFPRHLKSCQVDWFEQRLFISGVSLQSIVTHSQDYNQWKQYEPNLHVIFTTVW